MKKGLSYYPGCTAGEICRAGFAGAEAAVTAADLGAGKLPEDLPLACLRISGRELLSPEGEELFLRALARVSGKMGAVLLVDTFDLAGAGALGAFFLRHMEAVRMTGAAVCIENGCRLADSGGQPESRSAGIHPAGGRYLRNGLSDGEELSAVISRLNQAGGAGLFFGAVNVGRANLLGLNVGGMIRALGDGLRVMCFEDNDGREDYGQLPASFTTGRGTPTTDWPGIIRALAEVGFSGTGIMRAPGFLAGVPAPLRPDMLHFLYRLMEEWEYQIGFRGHLMEAESIILFGCGIRFRNYMKVWGNAFPPAFIADNNRALWGTRRQGIPVEPPEKILAVPKKGRLVLICNQYFIEIGKQLRDMGVSYRIYDDAYWGRFFIQ